MHLKHGAGGHCTSKFEDGCSKSVAMLYLRRKENQSEIHSL